MILRDRQLEDAGRAGILQRRDQRVDLVLGDDGLDREPAAVGELADGRRLERGHQRQHGVELLGADVQLDAAPCHAASSVPISSVISCSIAWRLCGIVVRRAVGDHLGVAGEDRVDDPQTGGAQRPAGLGDVDDAVGDVGDLRLAGAVRQPDVGVDALRREEAAGRAPGTRC